MNTDLSLDAKRVLDRCVEGLVATFEAAPDKREAHRRCRPLLEDMAADPRVLTAILRQHVLTPGALDRRHYPVVSLDVAKNPHFHLVANCWIPLPDGRTDLSTKAIHHHGKMLLSTVTAFGPGYEHWTFSTPIEEDPKRKIYRLELLENEPHPLHHVAFVDSFVTHLPMYPRSLTVTFALWSNSEPTSWRDALKRVPILEKNSDALRKLAARAGLARQLDLKLPEYFDFCPTGHGFAGIKERKEFERGPNEDYLYSLFHVLQETGNQELGREIRRQISVGAVENRHLALKLVEDLESGIRVEGRLSDGHYTVPFANFDRSAIAAALAVQG